MKIFWLRPSANDLQQCELIQAKQKQEVKKIPTTPRRESTKFPFHYEFERVVEIMQKIDFDLLTEDTSNILSKSCDNWKQLHLQLSKLENCKDFFNIHVNSLFTQLVYEIFSKRNQLNQIKTLILTIDYFMKIQTFLLFLYWKLIIDFNSVLLVEQILIKLVQIRYICLNVDFQVEQFIHFLFDNRFKLPQVKQYEIIPQPLLGYEELDLFSISPDILANAISEINEEFYSQLQFNNLLSKIDQGKQSQFLNDYFNRINSFSLFVQACILKKKDRKKAIDYFYEVCLELCKNEDGEGVFLIYTLSIERIDQDLLHQVQYISPSQKSILIDMTKTFVCNKHIYTTSATKKLYPIPSFYYFWTKLKKLELIVQQNKSLEHLEAIQNVLLDLMFIRQSNYSRLQNRKNESDPYLKYFLLKGHQQQLSDILDVPIGNWNQMQLKLMKMASN